MTVNFFSRFGSSIATVAPASTAPESAGRSLKSLPHKKTKTPSPPPQQPQPCHLHQQLHPSPYPHWQPLPSSQAMRRSSVSQHHVSSTPLPAAPPPYPVDYYLMKPLPPLPSPPASPSDFERAQREIGKSKLLLQDSGVLHAQPQHDRPLDEGYYSWDTNVSPIEEALECRINQNYLANLSDVSSSAVMPGAMAIDDTKLEMSNRHAGRGPSTSTAGQFVEMPSLPMDDNLSQQFQWNQLWQLSTDASGADLTYPMPNPCPDSPTDGIIIDATSYSRKASTDNTSLNSEGAAAVAMFTNHHGFYSHEDAVESSHTLASQQSAVMAAPQPMDHTSAVHSLMELDNRRPSLQIDYPSSMNIGLDSMDFCTSMFLTGQEDASPMLLDGNWFGSESITQNDAYRTNIIPADVYEAISPYPAYITSPASVAGSDVAVIGVDGQSKIEPDHQLSLFSPVESYSYSLQHQQQQLTESQADFDELNAAVPIHLVSLADIETSNTGTISTHNFSQLGSYQEAEPLAQGSCSAPGASSHILELPAGMETATPSASICPSALAPSETVQSLSVTKPKTAIRSLRRETRQLKIDSTLFSSSVSMPSLPAAPMAPLKPDLDPLPFSSFNPAKSGSMFGEFMFTPLPTLATPVSASSGPKKKTSNSSLATVSSFASSFGDLSTHSESTAGEMDSADAGHIDTDEWRDGTACCSDTKTVYLFVNENKTLEETAGGRFKTRDAADATASPNPELDTDGDPEMDAGVFTTDEANQCFKCVCGKLFKKLYNLKNHYKMHSTDKPYICSVCQRGFMRKHDLKRHATTHLQNFRPFECEDCHTLFTRLDALHRHIRARRCRAV